MLLEKIKATTRESYKARPQFGDKGMIRVYKYKYIPPIC
jgi:hypothetical protein